MQNTLAGQNKINNEIFEHKQYLPNPNECKDSFACRTTANPAADFYGQVLPVRQDCFTRDRLPSTEMFGGAFKQRGDGEMLYPDVGAKIRGGALVVEDCRKKIEEKPWHRAQCVDFPLAYETTFGIDTRQGQQQFFCK